MDKNFIATTDEATAEKLRKLGFQELPKQGSRWMFINDNKINFSSDVMKDVQTTNILHF